MEHLDEGTIHAWIDGALDATQSREIEAHIAKCPTCSAAVAEARGLIAASSRILNALDDVPGGVVPKRVPGAVPAAATPQARRWRIGGWIPAAAAAALILAVGLVQVNKEKSVAGVAETSAVAQDTFEALGVRMARPAADSAVPQQAPAASAPRVGVGESNVATGGPVGAISRPRDMSLADARSRDEGGRIGGAAGGGAASPVAQRAAVPAPPPATKDEAAAESKVVTLKSAAETQVVTAAPEPVAQRRLDRATITDVPALPQALAGCYRIERETRDESLLAKAANVAGGVAGAAAARVAPRSRAPTAAAAPAAERSQADFAAVMLPNVVRLDTAVRPLGLPVLGERSDSLIGWWTRSGRDSAQVRFLSGFVVTITAKNRVTCPER